MAICGLPPLNGFVSEWLVYLGSFRGAGAFPTSAAMAASVSIVALALIGGLAAACFVKAFGVVFLGEPRSAAAEKVHRVGAAMQIPMLLGAALCLTIGVWPAGAVALVRPAATVMGETDLASTNSLSALPMISAFAGGLLLLTLLLALLRKALLHGREVASSSTWGCGYPAANARMQYTANSFAEPVLAPFSSAIHGELHRQGPSGYFPITGHYDAHLGDLAAERLLVPAVKYFLRALSRLEVLQQGRIQLYLVYVIVTLVALLIWQFTGLFGH
jgi:hydrogenase-4 component B